jgi:hypothetical protein
MKENLTTAIYQQKDKQYSLQAPFNPPQIFPETPIETITDEKNEVYASVRELFKLLKYDLENEGTNCWNPLGWLIKPNETVFLKPNMIAESHYYKKAEWNYVITNGTIIRAVVDFVFIALKGKGKIIIGDSPSTESDFEKMKTLMGLKEIQKLYAEQKDFEIELVDLRDEYWVERDRIVIDKVKLSGDPAEKCSLILRTKACLPIWMTKTLVITGLFTIPKKQICIIEKIITNIK